MLPENPCAVCALGLQDGPDGAGLLSLNPEDRATMGGGAIRILIVDDKEQERDGLRLSLMDEDGIEVVGEAENGAVALEQVAALKPDVVLMDLRMPIMSGVEATRQITEPDVHPSVVILTSYDTEPDVGGALKAGAAAYLKKEAPTKDLLRAIRGSVQGGSAVPVIRSPQRQTQKAPAAAYRGPPQPGAPQGPPGGGILDEMEMEVIKLVAAGYSNGQAAFKLTISEQEVKNYLFSCYRKLGKQDRSGAVGEAYRRRLL